MPVFYFSVRDGEALSHDTEGSEMASASAALVEVREMARDMVIDELRQHVRVSDSVIEVTDRDGRHIGACRLRDILDGDPLAA